MSARRRPASPTKKPKLDPGLLAAHKAYEAAINSNQTDLVMAMYDPGAAQMPPDAPQTVGWKQLREAVDSYFRDFKTHWNKVVQANWVDGEWGFDQGHDTAVDIAKDGSGTTYWDCKGILIYRKQPNGEWKVFRDIWNNNKPPRHVPAKGEAAKKPAAKKAAVKKAAVKKAAGKPAAKKPAAKKPAAKRAK